MRRAAVLLAPMMLLLCACSGENGAAARFAQWRAGVENVQFTAEAALSDGDYAAGYELSCDYTPDGCSVEILAPEIIAGVTASRSAAGAEIEYDWLILSLGSAGGVSPMNAMPMLADAVRGGHVINCWEEDGGVTAVQLSGVDDIVVHLWLDGEMTPVRADIEYDGEAAVKLAITEWRLE